jgi:hypothetical protein
MKRGLFVIIVGLFVTASTFNGAVASDYAHNIDVEKMSFAWKVDGENLVVKLSAETTGWVGIGFNPSKKMKDANYVIGYVKKGEAKIRDDFGVGERKHKADEKLGGTSNSTLIGGTEENGMTTLEFSLPLSSGDKHDTIIDPAGDTIVLLAYGGKRDSLISAHKYRTTLKVNLNSGTFEEIGKK